MQNLIGIGISYSFIFIVILFAKIFEKNSKEASRKFIHIVLCNWYFIAILLFKNVVWASIGPASFVIINYLSYKRNLISVMERENNKQEGLGTVYYALALLILVSISFGPLNNPYIGLLGILVMGYGDGLAAIIGKLIKSKEYRIKNTTKTIAGSVTMFLVSFVVTFLFFLYMGNQAIFINSLIIAVLATITEGLGFKGLDNITVPIVVFVLTYLMI